MAKTIIQLGKRPHEFDLFVWEQGSAIRVVSDDVVADDGKVNNRQVRKTKIIGATPRGDVLRYTVSGTNRG
jgi:hypothetical protein